MPELASNQGAASFVVRPSSAILTWHRDLDLDLDLEPDTDPGLDGGWWSEIWDSGWWSEIWEGGLKPVMTIILPSLFV